MITLEEYKNMKGDVPGVFDKLFEARNVAHHAHLLSNSHSQHVALQSFYEGIVELADELYETYAGQHGLLKFDRNSDAKGEIVAYMETLGKFMLEAHSSFSEKDTHLHNILDEIVALVYRTSYKLKFLK